MEAVESYMGAHPNLSREEAETYVAKPENRHLIDAAGYTFSGVDRDFLAGLPFSRGERLEAIIFKGANLGMDRLLHDLMRPLFHAGLRPETFAM